MDGSAETEHLAFAVLSLATAVLGAGIYGLTGTWPSELGRWGIVLLVLVGLAIAGTYVLARVRVGRDTTGQ